MDIEAMVMAIGKGTGGDSEKPKGKAFGYLDAELEEQKAIRAEYKRLQELTRKAEQLKISIAKSAKDGASIGKLLAMCLDCIGSLTDDIYYPESVKTDVIAIQGHAAGDRDGLSMELAEYERRLAKMQEYVQTSSDSERVERTKYAIKQHEKRIYDIKNMMEDAR